MGYSKKILMLTNEVSRVPLCHPLFQWDTDDCQALQKQLILAVQKLAQ